jgi:hypothetical protein
VPALCAVGGEAAEHRVKRERNASCKLPAGALPAEVLQTSARQCQLALCRRLRLPTRFQRVTQGEQKAASLPQRLAIL